MNVAVRIPGYVENLQREAEEAIEKERKQKETEIQREKKKSIETKQLTNALLHCIVKYLILKQLIKSVPKPCVKRVKQNPFVTLSNLGTSGLPHEVFSFAISVFSLVLKSLSAQYIATTLCILFS